MTTESTPYVDPYRLVEPGAPLPDRNPDRTDQEQGLYHKFIVRRVDGNDAPGFKHHGCDYFVIDVTHDAYAKVALRAYIMAASREYPYLGVEMIERYNVDLEDGTTPELAAGLLRENLDLRMRLQQCEATLEKRLDMPEHLRNANVTLLLDNNQLRKQLASATATLSLVDNVLVGAIIDAEPTSADPAALAAMKMATGLIDDPAAALAQLLNSEAVNPWKSALVSELVIGHIHTKELDNQPVAAVHALVNYADRTALDASISQNARSFGANLLEQVYYHLTDGQRRYNPQHQSILGMSRNFREFGVLVTEEGKNFRNPAVKD